MGVLRYSTAGESHGPAMLALVNGLPAGVPVDLAAINGELSRRQGGYGRGGRQRIEHDEAQMLAGVRGGRTTGGPVAMQIVNRDSRLDDPERTPPVHRPRPGHADLAGSVKWLTTDCRDTLERASARETAARVAAGALARCLLRELGVEVFGFVRSMLDVQCSIEVSEVNWRELRASRDQSEVYCPDSEASAAMIERVHRAKVERDTVGGVVETQVFGAPLGLGTCVNWEERLDSRLAAAVMGIQAFKGVEIGLGFECARRPGSQVHDPIAFDPARRNTASLGYVRPTNNAGGLEGGMTNGMPIVVRGAMKPISTLLRGMPSVDLRTHDAQESAYERSDISAVPAASVVMENVVAFEVARAASEKFGGDTLREVLAALKFFVRSAGQRGSTSGGSGGMDPA
jgi:chorismate synthase